MYRLEKAESKQKALEQGKIDGPETTADAAGNLVNPYALSRGLCN